eukprot:CFRG8554T1
MPPTSHLASKLWLVCLLLVCACTSTTWAEGETDVDHKFITKFNPKPNGLTEKVTLKRGKVECTFEWTVTGGTDEQWAMFIEKDLDKRVYVCEIERPNKATYLYFMNWTATLSHLGDVSVYDNFNQLDMSETANEYFIDLSEARVSTTTSYSGALRRLVLETKQSGTAKRVDHKDL